jgi:hypothetical protein
VAFLLVNDTTLSAVVQNVAALVSYPVPSDPAGDTDPAVQQMVQAVNLAGLDLLAMHDWQELTKPYSLSITADTPGQTEKAFNLPEDFYEFLDQTQWNTSMQWPCIGPVSPQQWQQLIVRQTLPTLSFYWQVRGNRLYILAPPTDTQTLTFYYQSVAWVTDGDDPTTYKNRATKNADTILLDSVLVTQLTRVKWLEMKGLDSSAAMRDFQVAFENRKGNERGANVLSMVGNQINPLINPYRNIPDTGFGA